MVRLSLFGGAMMAVAADLRVEEEAANANEKSVVCAIAALRLRLAKRTLLV